MHENQQPQTEALEPSVVEREVIEHEMHHYEDPCAVPIEALKIAQKQRGWVLDGAVHAITDVLGIPASGVEGVATFYSQIFRQPIGCHVIRYRDNVICHTNSHQGTQVALEEKLNIKPGQATFDGHFVLLPTCYLGNYDKGSDMMIDEDAHAHLIPEATPELLERYK